MESPCVVLENAGGHSHLNYVPPAWHGRTNVRSLLAITMFRWQILIRANNGSGGQPRLKGVEAWFG